MCINVGDFSRTVLLSGAGLSRNWGGYLAAEFWSALIGDADVRACPAVRTLLLGETNFETALYQVRTGGYAPDDQAVLERAVQRVFESQDNQIRSSTFTTGSGVNVYGFQQFLRSFMGTTHCSHLVHDTGYLFTLNQDILLERQFYNYDNGFHRPRPTLPGIAQNPDWFSSNFSPRALRRGDLRIVEAATKQPGAGWPPQLVGQFNYIKLHGSWDWRTADGTDVMVIGGRKMEMIDNSPLLRWYLDVLRAVCCAGGVRLLVLGYSFNDEHINEIIAEGARAHDLQVYIMNPTAPDALQAHLNATPEGREIWGALIGHCPRVLDEVLPGSQEDTETYRNIEADFFAS